MFRLFKKYEKDEQVRSRLMRLCKKGDYGICSPPMDANVAIDELKNFFLGEDWCVGMPIGHEQIITEIVYQIETKYKRLKATNEQVWSRLLNLCKEGDYGICPPPMDANVAIDELKNFFLGEDWYVSMPIGHEQAITEIVCQIETKHKRLKATI